MTDYVSLEQQKEKVRIAKEKHKLYNDLYCTACALIVLFIGSNATQLAAKELIRSLVYIVAELHTGIKPKKIG